MGGRGVRWRAEKDEVGRSGTNWEEGREMGGQRSRMMAAVLWCHQRQSCISETLRGVQYISYRAAEPEHVPSCDNFLAISSQRSTPQRLHTSIHSTPCDGESISRSHLYDFLVRPLPSLFSLREA